MGWFGDGFGIVLGPFWDSFGIVLGSSWNSFGIHLGYFLDRCEIVLGSVWVTFSPGTFPRGGWEPSHTACPADAGRWVWLLSMPGRWPALGMAP